MQFNFGFEINRIKYGWFKKDLYRLPFDKNNRSYALLKLNLVINGITPCYCVNRKNKTLKSLEKMTEKVDWKVDIIKSKHLPF